MTAAPYGRICLQCRHVVADGCDQDEHQAVVLDRGGRDRLIEVVWGSRNARVAMLADRARRAQRTGAAAVVSGVASAISIAMVFPSRPLVTLIGIAGSMVGAGIASLVQRRADPAFPVSAAPRPAAPPFARGIIIEADESRSPVSGIWAAGWALELSLSRSGTPRVMMRDAWTGGLEIELDGGARARVPAGRWHPVDPLVMLLDIEDLALLAHLRELDPTHHPDDELSPFHHDAVHEALLMVGDRVELCGTWTPVPDERHLEDPTLYRDAPPAVLVPNEWASLRRG